MSAWILTNIESQNWVELKPDNPLTLEEIFKVKALQINGEELDYVFENMEYMPSAPFKRMLTLFGDTARFVLANQKWYFGKNVIRKYLEEST